MVNPSLKAQREDAKTRGTVGALLAPAVARLRDAGVATPRLDAELLLASAAGQSRVWVVTNRDAAMASNAVGVFDGFIDRRLRREPVSRILGLRSFWSHTLELTSAVLDPRADSETLVEAALEFAAKAPQHPLMIADLGTGSGCLLLALLAELPQAIGVGVDRDSAAISVARRNAAKCDLADRTLFFVGDWGSAMASVFDIIVCNPPYLAAAELERLQPEVQFDPAAALDGGDDGLHAYRAVLPDIPLLLTVQGRAFFEIGAGQADAVCALANRCDLVVDAVRADLSGVDRCVVAGIGPKTHGGSKK
ncbi:MAG: peptide chain release factor N(5)-glutamine methyltransferase [Proteobacteria bacterium]|nr:peptide chain release factor N(5)-glutamine methyltransferase [Pseudomonadota bacterium]